MRALTIIFASLGLLLLAAPAWGSDWLKSCRATALATGVERGGYVCNNPSADENSPMLSVGACENFDVQFFPDLDDGGGSANTVRVYVCGNPTDGSGVGPTDAGWDSTGVCWVLENVTLDGSPASNTEAIYGAAAEWIYVDVVTWAAADPRVIVRCNP